jgi:hypothetical protein
MTEPNPTNPTLPELEQLLAGAPVGAFPALRAEQRRLLAEQERAEELAMELRGARLALAERHRLASIRRVTFPQAGSDADVMVVSLNAGLVATVGSDGVVTEYRLDVLGFVPADLWESIEQDARQALDLAHKPRAGHASTYVVLPAGAPKEDLLAIHPRATSPMTMHDEIHFGSLAACLPLNERTATWARAAVDRGARDEREFCRVLARRFHAAGLDRLLEAPASTVAA